MLAASHLIGGGKPDGEPVHESHLVRVLGDGKRPVSFRVVALRLLRADHPAVSVERLGALLAYVPPSFAARAARALVRGGSAAEVPLLRLASNAGLAGGAACRGGAGVGLVHLRTGAASAADAGRPSPAGPRCPGPRSARAARDPDLARVLLAPDRSSIPEADLPEMAAQAPPQLGSAVRR